MERMPVLVLKAIGIELYCFLMFFLMWLIGCPYFIPILNVRAWNHCPSGKSRQGMTMVSRLFQEKAPAGVTDRGLKLKQFSLVAGARFCHYFTPTICIPLIPEEGNFPNQARIFLKIPV
jgi:hypothetical protein